MAHLHFDEYEVRDADLIFLPPEILKSRRKDFFQLSCSMDVWTLGMILLHCLCLDYRRDDGPSENVDEMLSLYRKAQGPSLINLEDEPMQFEVDDCEEQKSDTNSHGSQFEEEAPKKTWMSLYKNKDGSDNQLKCFLTCKMLESGNYSAKFMDFLRECLMFSPQDRQRPFDLLSHPVFKKYNKAYVSR